MKLLDTPRISTENMMNQGDRIAALLRQGAQANMQGPNLGNVADALFSATANTYSKGGSYNAYTDAMQTSMEQDRANRAGQLEAETSIYNQMVRAKDMGDKDADHIHNTIMTLVGDDPAKASALYDDIEKNEPEDLNAQNFLRPTLESMKRLGITNEPRSLGIAEKQADIALKKGRAEYYTSPRQAGGRTPSGYRYNSMTDALEPIPGGPADPTRPQNKPLPVKAIEELSKLSTAKDYITDFTQSFKDEYAGQPLIGRITNLYGRTFGEINTPVGKQANWWQAYQKNKNIIRKDLFGSALTVTEKQEWEAADINPSMDSSIIKENLLRQKSAIENAAGKIEAAYRAGNYNEKQIDAITKFSPEGTSQTPPGGQISGRSATKPSEKAITVLKSVVEGGDQASIARIIEHFNDQFGAGAADVILSGGTME